MNWAAATALGWMAGAAVALPVLILYVFTPLRGSPVIFVLLVGSLAVAGALAGWAQWSLMMRHLVPDTPVLFPRWLAVSAMMGIAAPFTCALTLRFPSAMFIIESAGTRTVEFGGAWLINVVLISIGVGVAVGLPQWFVLRDHIPNAHLWLYANMIAAAVTMVAFLGAILLLQSDVLLVILSCCGLPALFGAVSGWGLYRMVTIEVDEPDA